MVDVCVALFNPLAFRCNDPTGPKLSTLSQGKDAVASMLNDCTAFGHLKPKPLTLNRGLPQWFACRACRLTLIFKGLLNKAAALPMYLCCRSCEAPQIRRFSLVQP